MRDVPTITDAFKRLGLESSTLRDSTNSGPLLTRDSIHGVQTKAVEDRDHDSQHPTPHLVETRVYCVHLKGSFLGLTVYYCSQSVNMSSKKEEKPESTKKEEAKIALEALEGEFDGQAWILCRANGLLSLRRSHFFICTDS